MCNDCPHTVASLSRDGCDEVFHRASRESEVKVQSDRKFRRPELPDWVIDRERIDRLLEDTFAGFDVVELASTAGSGKTVAAELFARTAQMPTAWLSLDSADRSGARLLTYLAGALARIDVNSTSVAQDALRGGSTPPEGAAIVANHLETSPMLIVLDDCEHISSKEEAISVLIAFLTYLPLTARVLLLSREPLDAIIGKIALEGRVARLDPATLMFDQRETEQLLDSAGSAQIDATALVERTGGWAAGLIVGTCPAAGGPEYDLSGYLRQEVLDCLTPAEQNLILPSSMLDILSPSAAVEIAGDDGLHVLNRLRHRRLPAIVGPDGSLTWRPFFKDFLETEFQARMSCHVPEMRRRRALLLAETGELEEAVEILLALGEYEDAAQVAVEAVATLSDRGDWSLLLSWLERLGPGIVDADPRLLGAKVRALTHGRRLPEAQTLIRTAHERGAIARIAEVDAGVIAHVGWAFMCRPGEGLTIIDQYPRDHRAAAVHYTLQVLNSRQPAVPPPGQDFEDVDRILTWGLFVQGRLDSLSQMVPSSDHWPPATYYQTPHSLLSLIWRDELKLVHQLWDQVPLDVRSRSHTDLWRNLEAWILLADGDAQAALVAGQDAVSHSQRTRFGWEPYLQLVVGLAMIRLGRLDDARSVLAEALQRSATAGQLAYVEWAQTYQGLAQLLSGDDDEAVRTLRECVASMQTSGRVLNLPAALAYLSEAQARVGLIDESSANAHLASQIAHQSNSVFPLQQALIDLPDLAKRLETSAGAAAEVPSSVTTESDLEVNPFGTRPDLFVNGVACGVRRLKIVELAAYLALHNGNVLRSKIGLDLFPEHDLHSGGNYFRQIVHQFRRATGIALIRRDGGMIGLPPGVRLSSTDAAIETAVTAGINSEQELDDLHHLLENTDGEYLAASSLKWADDRRFELDVLQEKLLTMCTTQALDFGRVAISQTLATRMLEKDPYSEEAFRILDALAAQSGRPEQREIVYRKAKAALAEVGIEPEDIGLTAPEVSQNGGRVALAGR
jgi:LuxR family transcriptional regulator, maltose regulon positive regulatory protein